MEPFVHQAAATRVVFGAGSLARVPSECQELGLRRVLVLAGGSASAAGRQVATGLGERCAGWFPEVAQHVPEPLVERAVAQARAVAADGLCSVGGGSATGLAKAVAVALDLPVIAVPTTYAGSEATPVYGITGTRKRTATDPRARPRVVVYDPRLSLGLPARATAASGFNALAHAVAALAGPTTDPLARLYATEAVRLLTTALPQVRADPTGLAARGRLLWAAWLAGSALAAAGTGLHHRLCHVLGGSFGLVHADVHAVLLPHTLGADESLTVAPVARAWGLPAQTSRAALVAAVRELAGRAGAPTRLAELGLAPEQLTTAAAQAAEVIGGHDITWFSALLTRAYHDEPGKEQQ